MSACESRSSSTDDKRDPIETECFQSDGSLSSRMSSGAVDVEALAPDGRAGVDCDKYEQRIAAFAAATQQRFAEDGGEDWLRDVTSASACTHYPYSSTIDAISMLLFLGLCSVGAAGVRSDAINMAGPRVAGNYVERS